MKPIGPKLFIAIEPFDRVPHRLGLKLAGHGTARFGARDQSGIGQDVQMLHDRRQGHREWLRQLADRKAGLLRESHHQRAARRIGQRREGAIEIGLAKLNHVVKLSRDGEAVNGRSKGCSHPCAKHDTYPLVGKSEFLRPG